MSSIFLLDFQVDKTQKKIYISKEFKADNALVWDCWTKADLLDEWWAPQPYKNQTISMNFSEGGSWHYAMINPEGEKHYCKAFYKEITPKFSFSYHDAFTDESGVSDADFPGMHWNLTFTPTESATNVNIVIGFKSEEALESIIQMGFKEGFTIALETLEKYIESRFKLMRENKISYKARVATYLNFNGNTEEAFNFYKSVFRSEFINGIKRFGEIPAEDGNPPVPESIKDMVLHVELPILGGHILMGTDAPESMGFKLMSGNNIHISLEPESRAEADRLFNELSNGGVVTMPMADMFFGSYFGEFKDKFGINWMINFINR